MADEKTILVVDDEEPIREVCEDIFTQHGYNVLLAESAEQALDLLKKKNLMVMFLDIMLPNMNGYDLCKKIREKNPVAVIYAMTGYTTIFEIVECRKAGFDDFFTKPVSAETLVRAAGEAFEKTERWHIENYIIPRSGAGKEK
jgi:DNA-binding NtrC family response regulator